MKNAAITLALFALFTAILIAPALFTIYTWQYAGVLSLIALAPYPTIIPWVRTYLT